VRKFNWQRFRSLVWFMLAAVVVLVLWPLQDTLSLTDNTYTRRFCAYGSVYVEFQQGNKIWGTTFLDEHGKPVGCTDSDVQHTISNKEII
jgi:drug/metabolite transporter superfamily protein YnfA